jgi:hypothetical protein
MIRQFLVADILTLDIQPEILPLYASAIGEFDLEIEFDPSFHYQ